MKSEYAADARRGARAEDEAHRIAELAAFEEHFAVELRAVQETQMEVTTHASALDEATRIKLDWWHEQLQMLHKAVVGAAHFLPTSMREKYGKVLAEQEARRRDQRERLAPKKKFGFKSR